jgi:glutamine amidotransferase PdxT
VSSSTDAESFQRDVGVVWVILKSGLLNWTAEPAGAMGSPMLQTCAGKPYHCIPQRSRDSSGGQQPGIFEALDNVPIVRAFGPVYKGFIRTALVNAFSAKKSGSKVTFLRRNYVRAMQKKSDLSVQRKK